MGKITIEMCDMNARVGTEKAGIILMQDGVSYNCEKWGQVTKNNHER